MPCLDKDIDLWVRVRAQAAGHTKDTYLGATYRLLAARRGKKKAAVAVARHILEAVYYMLRDGVGYRELGANYHDERRKEAIKRHSVARLRRLGYEVTLQPVA